MAFKLKQSIGKNDEREQMSVDFIKGLLRGNYTNPQISVGEKGANTDGYIELLDQERQIVGKLTVQVKTVPPSLQGKHKYACPTSLFAYAENFPNEVVMLLAVDHSEEAVLWKYISRPLIEGNRNKENQETITLHFEDNEIMTASNVGEVLKQWNRLFINICALVLGNEEVAKENEQLRCRLLNSESLDLNMPKEEVIHIQQFSDLYNYILDGELVYVKQILYPRMWKKGIAVSIYSEHELLYGIYPIMYGENGLLIKRLPIEELRNKQFGFVCHSCENTFMENPQKMVKDRIINDIERFFKYPILPGYDYFVMEYIHNFIRENANYLHISKDIYKDYEALHKYCIQKYPYITERNTIVVINRKRIEINFFFGCLQFILAREYKYEVDIYPPKGHYASTGSVTDRFDSKHAFDKVKIVLQEVYAGYTQFIHDHFPLIESEIDMIYGADFVIYNLDYGQEWPQLCSYYFYNDSHENRPEILFTLNKQHDVYNQCRTENMAEFFEHDFLYKGRKYEMRRSDGLDMHKVLFNNTCLTDTFYYIFQDRLSYYVKNKLFR